MDKLTEEMLKEFDEIGFGNQARIVGVKRVELKDFLRSRIDTLLQKEREAGKREGIEMLEGAKIPYEHYWPRAKQEQRLCETCNEVVERYTPCKASKHYPCWQALNDLIQLIQEEI